AEALAALEALRERRRAGACALDTTAALRLAGAVGDRYRTMKATRAALDFDDLILKTRDLLLREGGAGWALYKLDQGVDHILVDEAQDTNPEQWQVIHALAGEFFQEKDSERTLFAVGDPKQSIFSFQRADPAEFARSRTVFNDAAEGTGQEFKDVQLQVSFRSVPAVLAAVDAVFAGGAARDGLARPGDDIRHIAARAGLPGRVEFWPLMPAAEPDAVDAWTPLKAYPERGARADARLAERIAEKIKALIDDPAERLAPARDREGGRRIRAGDIMVVVQRRGAFGDALARALKAKGVATAGVDRMRLSRQLAVRDLLALGQVAVLPEDDLALACFLKSPLGGIDEDGLFRLAHGRGRTPLWQALKRAATGPA
ncbi:MAG: UvrD-helicase domain-containing protein, partial [Alphaproteobacteria bacterium]